MKNEFLLNIKHNIFFIFVVMGKQLFVLIATGEAVSNLPPLFEFGKGGDEYIWVLSEEAISKKWTQFVDPLLKRRRLQKCKETIYVGNSGYIPSQEQKNFRNLLKSRMAQCDHLYFIANGGTKILSWNVLKLLEPFNPTVLYGEGRVPVFLQFDPGFQKVERKVYKQNRLTLEEVFAARGYEVTIENRIRFDEKKRIQLDKPITLTTPKKEQSISSSVSFQNTQTRAREIKAILDTTLDLIIRLNSKKNAFKSLDNFKSSLNNLKNKDEFIKSIIMNAYRLAQLSKPKSIENKKVSLFLNELYKQLDILYNLIRDDLVRKLDSPSILKKLLLQKKEEKLEKYLNWLIKFWTGKELQNILKQANLNASQKKATQQQKENITKHNVPEGRILSKEFSGDEFENVVFQKVISFLSKRPEFHWAISEVGLRIKEVGANFIEIDIGILLRNGRLLELECKGGDINTKHIIARLTRLHHSIGRLAECVIVTSHRSISVKNRHFDKVDIKWVSYGSLENFLEKWFSALRL